MKGTFERVPGSDGEDEEESSSSSSSLSTSKWATAIQQRLQGMQTTFLVAILAMVIALLALFVKNNFATSGQVADLNAQQAANQLSIRAERLGFDNYAQSVKNWIGWGGNDWNWRANLATTELTSVNLEENYANIVQSFADLGAGVSGTPTSTGDRYLYYTTWAGTVECIDRFTGSSVWSYNVQTYILANFQPMVSFDLVTSPVMGAYLCSRSAPRIDGSSVYIGTLAGSYVFKFNRFTGEVIWIVQTQTHPYGILTAAPTVQGGKVCIGLASWEESAAFNIPNYITTFQGAMQCRQKQNGELIWTWNTLKPSLVAKYPILTGGAIWGSEFPYDASRNWFYVATGNVYQQPESVNDCIATTVYDPHFAIYPTYQDPCRLKGDYSESVVALDADTGEMQWQSSRTPAESWTFVCGLKAFQAFIPVNTTLCPQIPGDDTDFGQQPMFLPISQTGMATDMLVVGQKSGIMWGVSAVDGAVVWATITGPWGTVGGLHFGSATDGQRMFYANGNSGNISYSLVTPSPGYTTSPGYVTARNGVPFLQGHVGAIDVTTGEILWQTPLPCELSGAATYAGNMVLIGCGAFGPGPAGPSIYNVGQFYMLNADTGEIIYQNTQLLGAQGNGPAVVGDMIYIPAGYTQNFGPRLPIPAIGGIYALTITPSASSRLSSVELSLRAERLGFDTYPETVTNWVGWGGNDWNWRADLGTTNLTAENIQENGATIVQKFVTPNAAVSGTPTSTGDLYMYYTTWNGTVECINRFTGASIWSYNLRTYILANFQSMVTFDLISSPVMGAYLCSRSAPRIDGNFVYVTTLAGSYVFKFNRFTGVVTWIVQAQTHPYGILTAAPTVHGGKVCIGLASWEESAAFNIPNYITTFQGGVQCRQKQNGQLIWTWYTLDPSLVSRYSVLTGGAVWGSEFPYDASRNWFYVATGNVYQQPTVVNDCIANTVYDPHFAINPTYRDPCRLRGDYSESIVALNADTGVLQWQSSRTPAESWTFVCGLKAFQAFIPVDTTLCPQIPGDDTDFGQQPMFLPISQTGMATDMLVVGQKSGIMWGVSAVDGAVVWATITGPWGTVGGLHFGSATDGQRMFYANGNSGNISYSLVSPSLGYTTSPGYVTAPNGVVFLQGHVGAIDVTTGEILWQTPLPCELSGAASYAGNMVLIGCGAFGPGPAGPSTYNVAHFYMLNADTGEIIYQNTALLGAQANGPAVIGDMMYIPAGYTQNFGPRLPIPTVGGIYAMTVN